MTFPLKLALSLTVLAFPLVELALLIKVGGIIGVWPLFAIIVLTGLAGSMAIRHTGILAITRLISQVEAGGSPVRSLLDQFLSVTGGVLLILPGLVGDCAGLLLLIPAVRSLLLTSAGTMFESMTLQNMAGSRSGRTQGKAKPANVTIIEGEYERVEEVPPRERR